MTTEFAPERVQDLLHRIDLLVGIRNSLPTDNSDVLEAMDMSIADAKAMVAIDAQPYVESVIAVQLHNVLALRDIRDLGVFVTGKLVVASAWYEDGEIKARATIKDRTVTVPGTTGTRPAVYQIVSGPERIKPLIGQLYSRKTGEADSVAAALTGIYGKLDDNGREWGWKNAGGVSRFADRKGIKIVGLARRPATTPEEQAAALVA